MAHDVLQRDGWHPDAPMKIDTVFQLHKDKKQAMCELWKHAFGWELRLTLAGEMVQTQVCRSQNEWVQTFGRWKAEMIEKGWQ